jgi:hypothetical protein
MNDADPLRALCRSARRSEDPDEASRRALSLRLRSKGLLPAAAGSLLLATNVANATSAVGGAAAAKTSLVALAICVASGVGGGLLLGAGAEALMARPRASSAAVRTGATTASATAAHSAWREAPPSSASSSPSAPTTFPTPAFHLAPVTTASARPESAARLAAETRDLLEAQRALRDQNPILALELLDRQQRAHGRGLLSAERQAARVLALCAAGRSTQAKIERERFLALHPSSPLVGRVRESCDGH